MSCYFCYFFATVPDTLIHRSLTLISIPVWSVMQTEEGKRAIQFQFCRRCLIFCDRKFWWRSQNMTYVQTWYTPNWLKAGWQAWKFNNLEKSSPSHPAWHESLLRVSPGYVTYTLQNQKGLVFLNYLQVDTNKLSLLTSSRHPSPRHCYQATSLSPRKTQACTRYRWGVKSVADPWLSREAKQGRICF